MLNSVFQLELVICRRQRYSPSPFSQFVDTYMDFGLVIWTYLHAKRPLNFHPKAVTFAPVLRGRSLSSHSPADAVKRTFILGHVRKIPLLLLIHLSFIQYNTCSMIFYIVSGCPPRINVDLHHMVLKLLTTQAWCLIRFVPNSNCSSYRLRI